MTLAEMVRSVEAAVADLAGCTDGELVEALSATERVRSAMAAHASALTAACDRRQVPAAEGSASPGVWLSRVCDQRSSEGRRLVRQARRLEAMPLTAAAFTAGEIGEVKAAMLVAARTDRLAAEFDRCEEVLVDSAKRLDPDGLATALRRFEQAARDAVSADPASVDVDDDPQSRPTEIFLSPTTGGRYLLSGDVSFEDGAILTQGMETQMRALFHRGARLSDGARFEPAQRRGVALVETFKRGMAADPDAAGAQPLLLAVVDLELMTRRAERDRLREPDGERVDGERRPDCGCAVDTDHEPGDEERTAVDRRVHELMTLACTRRGEPPPPRWRPGVDPPHPTTADGTRLPVTTGARADLDATTATPTDDHQRPATAGVRADDTDRAAWPDDHQRPVTTVVRADDTDPSARTADRQGPVTTDARDDDDTDPTARPEDDLANPGPQAGPLSPLHGDRPADPTTTEPGLATLGVDDADTTRSNRDRCLALPVTDPFDLAGLDLVPAPDPTDPFDLGRCEIPGAGPIPLAMAQRLACSGRIARLVLGARSVPLDYGRAQRTATAEQRHALIARDGGCAFPGCDRPPAWCEAHHLDFWDDHDGPTDIDNLALLCSHHHHCVHDWHWTFTRTTTGWLAQSPTGKRLHRAIAT